MTTLSPNAEPRETESSGRIVAVGTGVTVAGCILVAATLTQAPAAGAITLGLATLIALAVRYFDLPAPLGPPSAYVVVAKVALLVLIVAGALTPGLGVFGFITAASGGALVAGGMALRRGLHKGALEVSQSTTALCVAVALASVLIPLLNAAAPDAQHGGRSLGFRFTFSPLFWITAVVTVALVAAKIWLRQQPHFRLDDYMTYRRLRFAAYRGNTKEMRRLLLEGAEPNTGAAYGEPPVLAFAIAGNRPDATELLLTEGGTPGTAFRWRDRRISLNDFAAETADAPTVAVLTPAADPSAREASG